MNNEMRENLINAAISAYDLCGNMQHALRLAARDDYGLSAAQIAPIEGELLIEAHERIQRSVPR